MKKKLLYILCLIIWIDPCFAQLRSVERIHIATDRTLYIAGETIWLSLYCFDMSEKDPCFSELSSVAYVELRSPISLIATAKLQIHQGRGGGSLALPLSLPTGNYKLIAYTKQMLNEDQLHYFDKTIPIYNTLSTDKIPETVLVQENSTITDNPYTSPITTSGHLEVTIDGYKDIIPKEFSLPLSIKNKSDEAMTFHISIAKVDVPVLQDHSLSHFFSNHRSEGAQVTFQNRYIPEYEGEIIRGKIINKEVISSKERSVFLSSVGSELEIYASSVDMVTGEFVFFTHSLYGNREITLAYPSAEEVSFELFDPFVKPPITPAPVLYMDEKYESLLTQRSIEMQVSHLFGIDTLFERESIQNDLLLHHNTPILYILDEYKRFPLMQDIMVEFISELRFRRSSSQSFLQILRETDLGWRYDDNSLVTIDGIAIFDHEQLFQFDPLQVKTVSIYQNSYRIGKNIFNGIAKFDTYGGNYPGLKLGKNVLIVDFQGVQYLSRLTGNRLANQKELPDLRSLLYWDPQIDLQSGENREIIFKTSNVKGKYEIVLEGVTMSGQVVSHSVTFTVE